MQWFGVCAVLAHCQHQVIDGITQREQLHMRLHAKTGFGVQLRDFRRVQEIGYGPIKGLDIGPFQTGNIEGEIDLASRVFNMRRKPHGQARSKISQCEAARWMSCKIGAGEAAKLLLANQHF